MSFLDFFFTPKPTGEISHCSLYDGRIKCGNCSKDATNALSITTPANNILLTSNAYLCSDCHVNCTKCENTK
jgi:hypothetical protein